MRSDQRNSRRARRPSRVRLLSIAALGVVVGSAWAGANLAAARAAAPELRQRLVPAKPQRTAVDADHHDTREVIVKFHEGTHIRLRSGRLVFDHAALTDEDQRLMRRNDLTESVVLADVDRANELLLGRADGKLARLFGRPEEALDAERTEYQPTVDEELADLNLYYMLVLDDPNVPRVRETIDALNALRSVELSYPEPLSSSPDIPPTTTIDVTPRQGYLLGAASNGIDAPWANRVPGGKGAGIRLIDVEGGWDKYHEDLPGSYFFTGGSNLAEGSHGAAVLGEIAASDNGYGAIGIVPDLELGMSSVWWPVLASPHNTAAAIDLAASHLRRGDVLVIEQHQPEGQIVKTETGEQKIVLAVPPGATCKVNCAQFGYLPAEAVQGTYDAVRRATAKGIVVVEAAGNGSMNLDDPFWGGRFDRSVRDSGAILVGAGFPKDRTAEPWTNFGARVDLQGWGDSVATLGYGGVPGGAADPALRANGGDPRQWYTKAFGGTSSATPIVAGAAAAVNGARLAYGDPVYDGIAMRQWLRATGSPQPAADAASMQIGPLPDLSRAIPAVGGRLDDVQADGVARGWTFHSGLGWTSTSLGVHFYVDGPAGSGKWAGSSTANVTRGDVNNAYNISGDHGFAYRIPNAFRDDAGHTLYGYGIDPSGPQRNVLLDNRVDFKLPNVNGHIDSVAKANGRVLGWAYAAQSPAQSIMVHAYIDGPWKGGGGTFAGIRTAQIPRPDVNSNLGIGGDHGFDFTLPSTYRDGKKHVLYVYGIDPRGVNDVLLGTHEFELAPLPAPSLTPYPLYFGLQAVGSKVVQHATLANAGPSSLDVDAITTSSGLFTVEPTTTCGTTLAAGASCVVDIAYRPISAGWSFATLKILTPNAAPAFVQTSLSGEAHVPQAQLDTTKLTFSINVGATAAQTLRLSNTGDVPLTIASMSTWGGAGFTYTPCPTTIAVNDYCEVTVEFKPTTAGPRGATLRFDDNGGGPHDVELEGTGVAVGATWTFPSSLSFGSVDVGSHSATDTVTLYNSGGAPMNVYGVTLAGPDKADFRVSSTACTGGTVLNPASSGCATNVVFAPHAAGTRHAQLEISTSSGPAIVPLTGTGTTPHP